MTIFHLVRHGAADVPPGVLAGRRPGIHLLPSGRWQAQRSADKLAGQAIDAICTSPMDRTLETAHLIGERLQMRPQVESALSEVDFGEWAGRRYEELDPDGPWPRFNTFRSGTPIPGGEWMLETQMRIVRWMLERREQSPDATIVAVSHADVIRSALVYFLGMPIDLMLRVEISPGSITTLDLNLHRARALAVNWTAE